MKISVLGSVCMSVLALLSLLAVSHRAYAFGGTWSSRIAPVETAAEEILFVDNPDSTVTAIVKIAYTGPAAKFAWIIPMQGKPKIGVSSDTVFRRLDTATAPEYHVEVTTRGTCKDQNEPSTRASASAGTIGAPGAPDTPAASVIKIDQGSIGPYDYVDIKVDPTLGDPAKAATDWLTTNGYESTSLDGKLLTPYLRDGLHLLAFRLTKGGDIAAIRPVILTSESQLPTIPIRPTSVAAHGDVSLKVWVIGPSQAVPKNYEALVLNEARIDWLSAAKYGAGTLPAGGAGPFGPRVPKPSNYEAVVAEAAREAGGRGFVTEVGAPASQYREKIWSPEDDRQFSTLSTQRYTDGIDAILAANGPFGGWDGWKDAIRDATVLPRSVTIDEFVRDPAHYRGMAKVNASRFIQLLHEKVLQPVADTAALLYKAPYLTRLSTTLRADDMTIDPVFDYNGELGQVSSTHIAKQLIQCNPALTQREAPWLLELPHGGVIVGKGGGPWPVALGSLPANLKTVMLTTRGAGTVLIDNTDDIGMKLFALAGTSRSGLEMLHPPENGKVIGSSQTVTPHGAKVSTQTGVKSTGGGKCSFSRARSGEKSVLPISLPLAGVLCILRRRRTPRHRRSPVASAALRWQS